MNRARVTLAGFAVVLLTVTFPVLVQAQGMWGPGGCWAPGAGWGDAPQGPATGGLAIDQAAEIVRQTLSRLENRDLVPIEIMEFSANFYAIVAEKSTGIGAFELVVERDGSVYPEPGPNMMWNAKYGHMAGWSGYGMMGGSGMMGGWGGPGYTPQAPVPATQRLTRDQARRILQDWLNQAFPGATAEEGTVFYGYFTFDFERNGKVEGMASVNAYTGQVWYHTWHGTFIREKELM